MRDSITLKRKRGRITEINLTGKAAGNFFKALMQVQGGKDNGKASETDSEHSDSQQPGGSRTPCWRG